MNKLTYLAVLFAFLAVPVSAATVTTIENDKVTVSQQAGAATTVVQTAVEAPAPIVAVVPTAVYQTVQDPRQIEGEIINVDVPESEILIRDINAREKRIKLKQGMINNYKVGDYVEIYLMADMREAKTIKTRRTADVEGEIISVDYPNNLIIVREMAGSNRNVLVRPGLMTEHKVGDRLKMYVAVDDASPQAVRLIRVR